MKKCNKCKEELPLNQFYRSGKYFKSYCKSCFNTYHTQTIKKYKGVYGIFSNNKCLYVGESSRVNERMSKHRVLINNIKQAEKHNPTQLYLYKQLSQHKNIIVKLLERTDNHKEQEKYFINKLKPLYSATS